jgi:hypothetical protein
MNEIKKHIELDARLLAEGKPLDGSEARKQHAAISRADSRAETKAAVYLLEIDGISRDKLEIVGAFASEKEAREAIPSKAKEALITKLPIGETYFRGIGEARHKHFTFN